MGLYPTQVDEGMDARFTGKPLSENPYTLFGDRIEASRYYSWAVGWLT